LIAYQEENFNTVKNWNPANSCPQKWRGRFDLEGKAARYAAGEQPGGTGTESRLKVFIILVFRQLVARPNAGRKHSKNNKQGP